MNKMGIHYAYWIRDWAADFAFYSQKAAGLGFDVLEITTDSLFDMTGTELNRIKSTAADNGIELTYCVGFSRDRDLSSVDPEIRKNGVDYARKNLELIHAMGGRIFAGINYSAWQPVMYEGITDKRPWLERSVKSIRKIIKIAEDFGIDYCVEVVNRYEQFLLNTAAEGVAFAKEVDSPNLKLLLDVFHMNIEEDNIGEAIIVAGDKLGHFHIGECNRKVPGRGHMPWSEIVKALHNIKYQGRIVMEPFVKTGGEVGRDIKVWRDLSDGADNDQMDADIKGALKFIKNVLCNA